MELNDDDMITIADAAEQAGMTIPRLRRVLGKPEWKKHVRMIERQTKTGTRSTSAVPVSVFTELLSAIQEQERNQNVHGLVPVSRKVLSDKDAEIEYLRGALRIAQESLLREQQAHSETRRLLASPPTRTEPDEQNAQTRSEPEAPAPKAAEEPHRKGWFAKLFGS